MTSHNYVAFQIETISPVRTENWTMLECDRYQQGAMLADDELGRGMFRGRWEFRLDQIRDNYSETFFRGYYNHLRAMGRV
jgi:hypothetical protein